MRLIALTSLLLACNRDKAEAVGEEPVLPAEFSFDSPAAADWLATGRTLAAGEGQNLDGVWINGEEMDWNGRAGSWSGEVELVRGINLLSAEAEEADGDRLYDHHAVIAGDFEDPGRPVEEALLLRLNQSGIDKLMELVSDMLPIEDLKAGVLGMELYSGDYLFGAVTLVATVDDLSMGTPAFSAEPGSGELALQAVLPDVYVAIKVVGDVAIFGDFDTYVYLSATRAILDAELTADTDDGDLVVELDEASLAFEGFYFDTSLLPDGVDEVFTDTVEGYVSDMIIEQISLLVPPLIDETLAGLDPSFSTELLGTPVTVAADFAAVDVDSDGLALELNVEVDVPSEGDKSYQGYLAAGSGEPEVDQRADIGLAISDDLMNRLAFELWRGGLIDLSISTEEMSELSILVEKLHASTADIELRADLPPVIVENNGQLQLQVGELQAFIFTPDGEFGQNLQLSISAWIDLRLKVEDATLGVELGDATFDIFVRDNDWGVEAETLTNMVNEAFPADALKAMINLMVATSLRFELPVLYGLSFDSAEVERDEGGLHTNASIEVGFAE